MFLDLQMCKKDLNTNSYPFPLLQMQFGLFLTHNILTSDDPSTNEETSTIDEGDNTTKMYIHVFYKDTTAQDQNFFLYLCEFLQICSMVYEKLYLFKSLVSMNRLDRHMATKLE